MTGPRRARAIALRRLAGARVGGVGLQHGAAGGLNFQAARGAG